MPKQVPKEVCRQEERQECFDIPRDVARQECTQVSQGVSANHYDAK